MKSHPLISITLPNFNYGSFLAETIEGVIMQTYDHWELLIVDDGSTDDSVEIIRGYAAQDKRVRPVYFEQNQGAMAAHANAWKRASGRLVFQYSSDDAIVHPEFFERTVKALEQHPEAGGFFGMAQMVGTQSGSLLGKMGMGPKGFIPNKTFMAGFIAHAIFVPGISSIWKRSAIADVGGFDHRLGPQTDFYINHAIPAKHGVVFDPTVFAKARISESNASYSSNTKMEEEIERFALCERKIRQQIRTLYTVPEAYWDHWRRVKHEELQRRYAQTAELASA